MGTPSIRWVDSGPTSPIQWIYREWVWEQGLSKGYNNKTWLWMDWITRTWTKVWNFVLGLGPRNWLFLLLLQCLVTKVFPRWCKLQPSSLFPVFRSPFLEGFLHYISHFSWSWPSICWSCRSPLECLFHQPPFQTFYELQQPKQHYSGVISSLMWSER